MNLAQFATQVHLGAMLEVYVISQVMSASKKLRLHLPAFVRRQVRSASPSDSWALVHTILLLLDTKNNLTSALKN